MSGQIDLSASRERTSFLSRHHTGLRFVFAAIGKGGLNISQQNRSCMGAVFICFESFD
ncbi:hypothetical protein FWH13_02295 [Candidatus Saccharibacteria bacterium]|nr:hypothetical protein [Candidatus Saccharibacteria bacterium]